MSEEEYNNKLKSVQRFIPFLENMIDQLKDPKMRNREQQLTKMESLYGMITDKKKKLKIETLQKCEEVIFKLYQKVKGENAQLPRSEFDKTEREKKSIYDMAGETLYTRRNYDEFDIAPSGSKSEKPKSFFLRKPPISYADLEGLEKDVAYELESKMSLQELNTLRHELCQQLEETQSKDTSTVVTDKPEPNLAVVSDNVGEINTTVRNKQCLTKISVTSDKTRKSSPSQGDKASPSKKSSDEPKKETTKIDNSKSPKAATPKILKEAGDIFGNAFSEIDKTYELGMKKKEERRNSLNKDKKENEDLQLTEKIAQVKHLAEKAAALRNKFLSPPKPTEAKNISAPDLNINKPPTQESEPKNQVPSEETSKPPTEKETSENVSRIDSCNSLENCINKTKDENEKDKIQKEPRKGDNQHKEKKHSDHKKEHKKSDHKKDEKRKDKHHSSDRNKKDAEKDKKPSSGVVASGQKAQEPPVETKPVSRDPRLKLRPETESKTSVPPQNKEAGGRLAYKYNPKPKKIDAEVDIEKNVADSIEKSMKESIVPLPPKAQLAAPPVPPNDLFSPQSPDEMNKTSVPNIINEMLLNPKTSGVINDVMTALKRSNNDRNLINVPTSACLKNNDAKAANMPKDMPIGCFERDRQPLFPQFGRQKSVPHFSPPPPLKFIPPQPEQPVFVPPQTEQPVFVPPLTEQPVFVPPKPLPPLNNMPPRGFNSFFGKNNVNLCDEMPVLDYQPPLESASKFDGHMNPPHLTPYEDRMQGFHMNFVPPSPSYVPPSPSYVPPSPSYVPPSPVYEGGNENYREMNNFQNFPMDRPQIYFDKGRAAPQRQQSLLGDFPARLPFEPKFGQQNFGNNYFYDQGTSGAFKEGGNNFFGAASRDPRVNSKMNRNFNLASDPRIRDNRMTYREYKEQRERENREKEMKEKEIREKEIREKELQERQRETEANERLKAEREEREREKQKIEERKDKDKRNDGSRPRDRSRDRARSDSRDRYSRNRSSSRYRRDRNEPRERSRERPRFTESRFDKVYSSRDKDKEDFTSPLDSLYSSSTAKTGKGYGIQFKIPKKVKEENPPKKDEKPKKEDVKIEKKDEPVKVEVKEELAQAKVNEKKENEVREDVDKKADDVTTTEVNNVPEIEAKPQECDDVVEVKEGIPVIEVKDSNEEEPAKIDEVKEEKPQESTSETQPKEQEPKPNRDEEESILSRFFQNLMKSTNKDEKKGALLSLISTFSDSFSDHQLKRITNIIKCEEDEEGTESKPTVDPNLKNEEDKPLAKETATDNESEISIPIESPSEKIEDKPADDVNSINSEETVEDTSVQVSVGERIKNRKRIDNAKTENKSKTKLKTELDRLHEDIREMFIRDGVVTATGKRMCRLLKDTTVPATDTEPEKTEDEPPTEESKKGKKKGRKATKKTKDSNDVEMKELSVVIPKMSLDKMKVDSEKRYSLRKPLKATNYSETEVEEDKSVKKITIEVEEPVKVEPEKEMIDESEKQSSEETKKVRAKKKPRKSWASGVIKKKSGGKLKKTKSPTPTPEESVPKTPRTVLPENAHDVDHYITPKMTKLACKICSVPTKWIAAHYRSEHPDIEVLSSRLPPDDAKTAIEDAIKNKKKYEDDVATSTVKHEYNCRFCDYNQTTLPRMYRDHVSIHTGEFRHRCPYCNFQRSHIKSMQTHVNEVHAAEEAIKKKPMISQPALNNRNIYAYICEVCHFVQMDKENVENHVKNFHSDYKNTKIHMIKINVEPPAKKVRSPRKAPKSKANLDEEENVPDLDLEGTKSPTERPDDSLEPPPLLTREVEDLEKSSSTLGNDLPSDAVTEDSETTNLSQDEQAPKTTRKRKKPFVKPTRKRLRRRVGKLPISSTDTESDADFQKKGDSENSKKICEAVFTCNTDLQEENKQIEEERLKLMQDINSTLQVRTSLDFVEKLSNRLKQEEEVVVKQEPEEVMDDTLQKAPPSELPVFEKSALQKRDVEQTVIRQDNSAQNVDKLNPISGVIEKLQGILSAPAPSTVEVNSLPPLTHKDQVERKSETLVNSVVLNIGPLKIIKNDETFIYACCSRPCIFSSRDVNVFKVHCKSAHDWNANLDLFPNCMDCNMKFDCDENNSLLSVALNHVNQAHSTFLGIKIGSIRVSSNLFPKDKPPDLDEVDVKPVIAPDNSGDVTPPTLHLPSPPGEVDQPAELTSTEVLPNDFEDENPFSFKIVDVVSLATDDDVPPLSMFENSRAESPPAADGVVENTPVTDVGTTPPITGKTTVIISKTVSPERPSLSPKTIQAASKGRKSPNAMKKFLSSPNDLFKCPEYACLFTTNNKKMFDIHVKMHPNYDVKALPCLYCDKVEVLEKMGEHYGYVHGRCRFCCVYCLYRCIAKDYMYIHQLLVHHNLVPRLQLLPRRESDEKRSMEFLHESTKNTQLVSYECCGEKFLYYKLFYYHVKKCMMISTTEYRCHYQSHGSRCTTVCQHVEDVLKHWVEDHRVYPFQCSYCDEGSYSIDIMMIHLVKEHPMLPPDVVDRRDVQVGNKNKSGPAKAKCRFKQLAESLRTNTYKQLSLEEDVLLLSNANSNNVVTTFPKVTPVSLVQTLNSSISLLKPTTKADVLASGGVVYCLGSPPPSNQNQPMKALVVNDSVGAMSQKVRLLAPVKVPPTEKKYQVLKNMGKIFAVSREPPMLAPLASRIILPKLQTGAETLENTPVVNNGSGDKVTVGAEGGIDVVDQEAENAAKEKTRDKEGSELPVLEEPVIVFDGEFDDKTSDEAVDPLSLEIEDPLTGEFSKNNEIQPYAGGTTPFHEYDSDSKDIDPQVVTIQKAGLIGYQLYRCAKCDLSFSEHCKFKDHLIRSLQCKFTNSSNKPYKCVHCGKFLKQYNNLLDHLGYHGHLRFLCTLCNKKYPHANQAKYHMKTKHNIVNMVLQPLVPNKTNVNNDEFVVKPHTIGLVKPTIKETTSEGETQKCTDVKTIFFSHEADDIPQKSILSYDITCGHCKKFKNKVRSNIVRHLLLHKNDKDFTVPDTAPVNPVPCLEKNEKMFDKMYNLASSSHAGGRMGGQQKADAKKQDNLTEENYPGFVPTNKRFQCCAVGCNYLCLEEGNLRHHLTALHMEDLNFICVHCKKDLSDAVDVDTILKHLKLHELHLYKCSICDFMHNLKHKIERHIGEKHKNKECTVVVLRAMDSEPYEDNHHQALASFPVVMNQKVLKPWRCCMCKYRCHTQEDAENHAKNKHDIDCRYKCALCTYKSNIVAEFTDHFKMEHQDSDVDIILVYHKEHEVHEVGNEQDQFDTTPLWLRDKPRVRHIRGILFDENSPIKKKGAPLKSIPAEQSPNASTGTAAAKKRKRSVSTYAETPKATEEDEVDPKREVELRTPVTANDDVIVIEDDEETPEPSVRQEPDPIELLCTYGETGMPLNNQFKCPKCDKYRTSKVGDFVQHLATEIKYYRFSCILCNAMFVTMESIKVHCIDYHECSLASVMPLSQNDGMNRWITLVLEEQRNVIRNLGFNAEEMPDNIECLLGVEDSSSHKEAPGPSLVCKECGLVVSALKDMELHVKFNHPYLPLGQAASSPQSATSSPIIVQDQSKVVGKKRKNEITFAAPSDVKKAKLLDTNLISKDLYTCVLCNLMFESVPEMEFHGRKSHGGEVSYTIRTTDLSTTYDFDCFKNVLRCCYCTKLGSKQSLSLHIMQDHPAMKPLVYKFSCGICQTKFENVKPLRRHLKTHELAEIPYYDIHDREFTFKPRNNVKNKIYSCPICPYISHSANATNMKTHLKIHAKPFQCDLCTAQFKNRPDARTHHLREHPHNTEMISVREDMVEKLNALMVEVTNAAQIQEEETNKSDSLVEDVVALVDIEDLTEVDSQNSADNSCDETVRTNIKNTVAKKSTTSLLKPDETKEYYSFYGQKPDPVDLKKIITTFEVGDAKMRMTCDQLGRIYNLKTQVVVKDCLTLIVDCEDEDE